MERPVAVSLDGRSHLAVLSVQAESTEKRNAVQAVLVKELRAIGVEKPCAYIINEFGDIHVYLCFDEEFKAQTLHPLLKNWLLHCELDQFVSLINCGEPLELPLQKDFVWTTNYSTPLIRRGDIALEPAIAMFLSNLSKGLLKLEYVMEHLSAFPIVLPEEPEVIEEEPVQQKAVVDSREDEFPGENIVSLARKREERTLRREQEEILLDELDSIEASLELKDTEEVASPDSDKAHDQELEEPEESEELEQTEAQDAEDEAVGPQESESEAEEADEFFSEALSQDEDQTLFEEMVDFNLNDIPSRPGDDADIRVNERGGGGGPILNQSSTMLPPPGTSTFKQLTIPFINGDLQ